MNKKEIKVLEVNVSDRGNNGVYSLIRNVIQNKPQNLNIDIATFDKFENSKNIKELNKYNVNVIYLGSKGNKITREIKDGQKLTQFLYKHHYDCVHVHSDVADKLLIYGKSAKKAKVKKIIFHSHASNVDGKLRWIKRLMHYCSSPFLKYIGNEFVSVSDLASKWMYPNVSSKKIIIIKNGINLTKFRFNPVKRNSVRQRLNLQNNLIIGHVGRFEYQKNHVFLIRVFKNILKYYPNARLLLIGEGKYKKEIEQMTKSLNIANQVVFYGTSTHVEDLLQAMDIFLLPSHFEGLPIVGVEAQAAGLPVIFSNKITKEAKIIDTVSYLPIEDNAIPQWIRIVGKYRKLPRKDTYSLMKKKGFSIDDSVNQFVKLYEKKDKDVY